MVAWMLLRLYTLTRVYHDYFSPFTHMYIGKKVDQDEHHKLTFLQTLKLLLNKRPLAFIAVLLPTLILTGGYAMHVLERSMCVISNLRRVSLLDMFSLQI